MRKADNLPPYHAVVMKSGSLNFLEPFGPAQACYGRTLLYLIYIYISLGVKGLTARNEFCSRVIGQSASSRKHRVGIYITRFCSNEPVLLSIPPSESVAL